MKHARFHLFQAYGIELEYMIVDDKTMAVKPITDELFKKISGSYCSDIENGPVTWSNELVLHVLEIKCTDPTKDLVKLNQDFSANITNIHQKLKGFQARLLPSAAHPLMDPHKETYLWPHDNSAVYERYNKLFNCQGHGWSNLQSCHINLPFYDDEEFAQLHAAVRLLLPVIPALSASSPVLSGAFTGFLDKRMDYYQKNQRVIPSITGKVIPERAFSKRQYHKQIYDRISHDLEKYNEDQLLNPVWVNSRGAIARFDRGSIEIRVIDIQECPAADLAIAALIIGAVKVLVHEHTCKFQQQQQWYPEPLQMILQETIKHAEAATINNADFLKIFGIDSPSIDGQGFWKHVRTLVETHYPEDLLPWKKELDLILSEGTLARRILNALENQYSEENIKLIYHELSDCLINNEMFSTHE